MKLREVRQEVRFSVESAQHEILRFVANNESDLIVIASHGGRRGHPIVFPYAMRETVDRINGGLRVLHDLFPERLSLIDVSDPGVSIDVDTAEDYNDL